MRKIKNFIKRHWNKVVALICVFTISFSTVAFAVPISQIIAIIEAVIDAVGNSVAVINFLSTNTNDDPVLVPNASNSDDVVKQSNYYGLLYVACEKANINQSSFSEFYDYVYNQTYTTDYSAGSISYEQFEFCSDIYNFLYKACTYYYITEEQWCRVLFDGNGNLVASSDYSVSDSGDVQISGKKFKQMVDYWSDYYKPKDNIDQFTYSYQDAANKQGKGNYYRFTPYAPVYTDTAGSSTGWGFHAWTGGAYFLPFLVDDDKGDYYSEKYYHIYSTRDDGTLKICIDTYLLKDNSLADSKSYNWDTARMNVGLAFFNNAYYLYFYKSYFDYKSNTDPYSNIYFSSALSTGLVTSGVSITPQYFLQNLAGYTTFTPDTDTADDYGFIISSSPFELWVNQTDIDTSKIPDDYVITPKGDTFYDYTITNTTGDTTTINKYVTNNYYIPETDKKDDDQGGSSGDVTVSGDVNVKGDIDVSGKVDININVSQGSSESAGDYIDPGEIDADLDDYLSHVPDVSKDFIDYLKDFFGWLPKEIYGLLVLGLVVAIFCRLNGR